MCSCLCFRFVSWIKSDDFEAVCHPLGDVSYYLGHLFVVSHAASSKGLVPQEEIPVEEGDIELPARYPGEMSWEDELRLLFPIFLRVNPRTYFMTGTVRTVIPVTTLMQASKHNPFLFMSLVLQRSYDKFMKWPTRGDAIDQNHFSNWKTCNLVKFPPVRQAYPISKSELTALRARVASHYVPDEHGAMLDYLPDQLSPVERETLLTCDRIDAQFAADVTAFQRHLL